MCEDCKNCPECQRRRRFAKIFEGVGGTRVPPGEGVLDTPEKIQAYADRMDEYMKIHRPKYGILPRKPRPDHPRRER